MKVTVWSIKNDKGAVIFNHLENGWSESDYPLPKRIEFKNQEAWKNMKWTRKYANLVDGVVVY